MSDIAKEVARLSPERRALLERLLRKEGLDISRLPIIPQSRNSNLFPLSFAQQRLWFMEQLEPGNPAYKIPVAVRLKGSLNVAVLEQSLNEIVRRHEILRTTFPSVDEQPTQVIAPTLAVRLGIVDFRELPETKREAEALRLATEEVWRPFNLTKGPLLRVKLLRLHEEEHVMLLLMHHIVSDNWSMGVFIQEIVALYEAFSMRKPSPLPELPIQYADFTHWQRQWLVGEVLETQLIYWKQQLTGAPSALDLLTYQPRPAVNTYRGARQSFVLSSPLFTSLKALSCQEEATLFMTLVAAFKTLLYRYTGQDDIVVGIDVVNRNRTELEGLIGFFASQLVLRTCFSGNPTFQELLRQVREVCLGAYAHQDLPFDKLVKALNPERDLSRTPLFQVKINFLNVPMSTAMKLLDLTVSPFEIDGTAMFDLELVLWEESTNLRGFLTYSTDLFDAATIREIVESFQILLKEVVAAPNQCLLDIPLVKQEQNTYGVINSLSQNAEQFMFNM